MNKAKKKFYITTTIPASLNFFKDNLAFLNNYFSVKAISSEKNKLEDIAKREKVESFYIPMRREISLLKDIVALFKFIWLFTKEKPDIVHGNTPKAALLSMFAAKITSVKVKIYMCHGLRYQGASGFKRKILMRMEKLTCSSADTVICVSKGVRNTLINDGLCNSDKANVIHHGSASGINLDYFKIDNGENTRQRIRKELNIQKDDFVFIFVGRIVGDKGINELTEAFSILAKNKKHIHLILVGTEEKDLDPISSVSKTIIDTNIRIHAVGRKSDIRSYLIASDCFVLPSYREGFGMVLIEAGAMELPCITTDITGCNEIIEEGTNGIIIPPKDVIALKNAMLEMIENKELYNHLKSNAREMITSRYEQRVVWEALLEEYKRLIDNV